MRKSVQVWGLIFLAACGSPEVIQDDVYGTVEGLTEMTPVSVAALVAEKETYLERTVAVSGTIHEVCQMAGCWLMLRALDGQDGVRVHVDRTESGEYAFTVPKDVSGRHAVAYGIVRSVDAEAEDHYQQDAPGRAPILNMVAAGVEIAPETAI
ncbi:MAG: DUF4920 domain-containing protein [Bacteroidota bacterium]|nr:DUF4920 domain-containing protein [Bacteroidota bacterium]